MLKLDFTYADLNLPEAMSVTRRQSISGVQQKMKSSSDFVELGACYGVDEASVREAIREFLSTREVVDAAVSDSRLSAEAKSLYLSKYHDRLRAIAQ